MHLGVVMKGAQGECGVAGGTTSIVLYVSVVAE